MANKLVICVIDCPATAGDASSSVILYWDGVAKYPNMPAYAAGGLATALAANINTNDYVFNGTKLRAVANGNSLVLIGVAATTTATTDVVHMSYSNFPDAMPVAKWTNADVVNPYAPGTTFTAADVASRFAAGCVAGAVISRSFPQ